MSGNSDPQSSLPALFESALGSYRAGDVAAARKAFEGILERHPGHPDALNILGVMALDEGRYEAASGLFARAVAAADGIPEFHCNLGHALQGAGKPAEAIDAYRRAVALRPEYAEAHNNLGFALASRGELDAARESLLRALDIEPGFVFALNNLGDVHREQGNLAAAESAYGRAIAVDGGIAEIHAKLAIVLREQGKLPNALHTCRRWLELAPDSSAAHHVMGLTLAGLGEHADALEHLWTAVARDPQNTAAQWSLGEMLGGSLPGAYRVELEQRLLAFMDCPAADFRDLARFTTALVKLKYGLGEHAHGASELHQEVLLDPLVSALLTRSVNDDADLERALAGLRRRLLLEHAGADPTGDPEGAGWEGLSALALQGLSNEYVFAVGEEERASVDALQDSLESHEGWESGPDLAVQHRLVLYALYRSPGELAVADALRRVPLERWCAPLRPLVTRSLLEPMEELALDDEIAAIGATTDAVSRSVRAQYEDNPYPRWLAPASRRREPLGAILVRQYPHFEPPSFLAEPLRLLVAGCGTGYHPVSIALRYENVEILATDVSRASLRYALRMARGLGVENVTFVENDILNVAELDGDFHVIECVGVLHHLSDPAEGLALLVERLRPGGLMKLGLYSAAARRPVTRARERIEALGLRPVAEDIVAFRQSILESAPEEALRRLLDYPDFYTLSSCRDLLFHVQEHCYDPEAIGDLLNTHGLDFIGFEFTDPSVSDAYRRRFPDDTQATDLSHWSAFENEHPALFASLYQFWCQRR